MRPLVVAPALLLAGCSSLLVRENDPVPSNPAKSPANLEMRGASWRHPSSRDTCPPC
jgi:hypothetical protein